jgi:hypothetical protein
MPWVRFEPTIAASERAKTVHALDRWATVTSEVFFTQPNSSLHISSQTNYRLQRLLQFSAAKSQSYFTTDDLPSFSSSWRQAPWDSRPKTFFKLNPCGHSPYVTLSLWREDGFVSHDWPFVLCPWPFVECTYRTYSVLCWVCIPGQM